MSLNVTLDLTQAVDTITRAAVGTAIPAFLLWLKKHLSDRRAAYVIAAALRNAPGAMQQAAGADAQAKLLVGLDYVRTQARTELQRFPEITTERLLEKLRAQLGLVNIASNLAVAGSPDPAPPPLAPVAVDGR